MIKTAKALQRLVLVLLCICAVSPLMAAELFLDIDSKQDVQTRLDLKKIAGDMNAPDNIAVHDFFQKGEHEYFFRNDDGLFYANIEQFPVLIEQIFFRSLGQIEPEAQFNSASESFIIFRNNEMRSGIITDNFSVLEIKPAQQFDKQDFYQLYGFARDDEESGENGIEEGEAVSRVMVRDIDNDRAPEIVVTLHVTNYQTKTTQRRIYVFKRAHGRFAKWKEVVVATR